jgi:hypothetical protein
MRHRETRLCGPDLDSGRFFCPLAGPLTLGPLTLPSPRWGEGAS